MQRQEHHYGRGINLYNSATMNALLARFGSPTTPDHELAGLMRRMYAPLLLEAVDNEFPTTPVEVDTRMRAINEQGVFRGDIVNPETSTVVVNVIRAGIVPSEAVFEDLRVMLPGRVRLDHLVVGRTTNEKTHVVTGATISSAKIDKPRVDGKFLVITDPMGATGGTSLTVINHYLHNHGAPAKTILMHLMVTPEYIRRMQQNFTNVSIYALRLDRGLSPQHVLKTPPGTHWDEERGLTDEGYLVPGAGDVGAKMNGTEI